MKDIPFVAIDSDQLGEKLGDQAPCPKCGKLCDIIDSDPPGELQAVKCCGGLFMVGLDGRKINR